MMKKKIIGLLGILLSLVVACDDLEDKFVFPDGEQVIIQDYGTAEMYILSEGLFNLNNSTLARYSFETNACMPGIGRYGKRYGYIRRKVVCRGECVEYGRSD